MVVTKFQMPKIHSLPKIVGVCERRLYVFIHNNRSIDIYWMNVHLPGVWHHQWHLEFAEIAYVMATVMPAEKCIYLFFTGCFFNEGCYSLEILRLDIDREGYERYACLDASSVFDLADLYKIHFETSTLNAGQQDLCIYDRGVVKGVVSFTRFILNHNDKTFTGKYEPIAADDPEIEPTVFSVLIDPDQRMAVKLSRAEQMRVFNAHVNKWLEYKQSPEGSDVYLSNLRIDYDGIGVTFNQERTRFTLVSSQIKLVAGDGFLLLIYKHAKSVLVCRVILDHDSYEYKLKEVDRIPHQIAQGYVSCNEGQLIILSHPVSYYYSLDVLTLRELAFCKARDTYGDGKDDENIIRRICGFQHKNALI